MPRKRQNLITRKYELVQLEDGHYSLVDRFPVEKDWRDGKPYSVWKQENDNSDNSIFNNCIRKLYRQYNELDPVIQSARKESEKTDLIIKRIMTIKNYLVDILKYRLYLTSAERSKFELIPDNQRLNCFTDDIDNLHQYLEQNELDLDKKFDTEFLDKIFSQISYILDNIKKDSEKIGIDYYADLVEEITSLSSQFAPYFENNTKQL